MQQTPGPVSARNQLAADIFCQKRKNEEILPEAKKDGEIQQTGFSRLFFISVKLTRKSHKTKII